MSYYRSPPPLILVSMVPLFCLVVTIVRAVNNGEILSGGRCSRSELIIVFIFLVIVFLGLLILIFPVFADVNFYCVLSCSRGDNEYLYAIVAIFYYGICGFFELHVKKCIKEGFSDDSQCQLESAEKEDAIPTVYDLINAVQLGDLDEVSSILAQGVNINDKNADGETALDVANICLKSEVEQLRLYRIDKYAKVHKQLVEWGARTAK